MADNITGDQAVLLSEQDGLLTLRLNRPEKLNAFNRDMHCQLRAGFEKARDDDRIRAVLLTGTGRGFSAGQDLNERDSRNSDQVHDLGLTLETYYNPTLRLIRSLPKPVIAAVNGIAAGAGANLALTCDFVLAARSAKFIQAFSKIGLIPDSGGSWLLTRALGEARAKGLTMLAEPLSASQAADWGLIWKVIDDEALMTEAEALAMRLCSGPTYGLGLTKALIHEAAGNTLDEHLDRERDSQRLAGHSADYAEGVAAFLDKRQPHFKGH